MGCRNKALALMCWLIKAGLIILEIALCCVTLFSVGALEIAPRVETSPV